jgi:hypothetical protein
MEIVLVDDQPGEIINNLATRAHSELPDNIRDDDQQKAWVAKRMIEIAQRDRNSWSIVQALLAVWVGEGELWRYHPQGYSSLREFLGGVGNDVENNHLSPSSISDMVAVADVISPYCASNGIEVSGFITSDLWAKFREGIPSLRDAVKRRDIDAVNAILSDVKALSTRDAMRKKHRQPRTEKPGKGECFGSNGVSFIVVEVPSDQLGRVKSAFSSFVEWDSLDRAVERGRKVTIELY